MPKVICRNPATGAILRELEPTSIDTLTRVFENARTAQRYWASVSTKRRAKALFMLREALIRHSDDLEETICSETGKPRIEALANEIVPCVDALTYFAHRSKKLLKDRAIPLQLVRHRKSSIEYWPLGVVAVISPWNYPFLLPFMDIFMALVAGNAVVHKPSEVTSLTGLKIQEICDEAGFPAFLLQTIIGDGALGAALIDQKPNKIFFTGSVSTGQKIMAQAARNVIPVNLELGGKDPMIVLPDANLDFATSAALWGAFSNSGQMCSSVERILVHESIAAAFTEQLKDKAAQLRQGYGPVGSVDQGVITYDKQRETLEKQLDEARSKGATFAFGGALTEDRRALKPTLVGGSGVETLEAYREESFGNLAAITTFHSVAEAIQKANQNQYGLCASIITRDLGLGQEIARQLEVGTVTINETSYTAGLGETPWGGVKLSGFGRSHADVGLLEFVNARHVHQPRSRLFVFKSFWWFPYGPYQYATFKSFLQLYRRHWTDKLRAFPHFLWNLVQFLKHEKRL